MRRRLTHGGLNTISALWLMPALFLCWASSVCGSMEHKKILTHGDNSMTLQWSFTEEEHHVSFKVQADTEGPIYLAFSHDGAVNRTNTMYDGLVGGVDEDGEGYLESYIFDVREGGDKKLIKETDRVVFQLDEAEESGGVTTLKFKRVVSSCFFESFDVRGQGDVALIMFKVDEGEEDPDELEDEVEIETDDFEFSETALFTIVADSEMIESMDNEANLEVFEIVMDDEEPGNERLTLCKAFKINEDFDYYKGFKPIINPVEDDVSLRVMIAYQCDGGLIDGLGLDIDTGSVSDDLCNSDLTDDDDDQTLVPKACSEVLFTWGPGSEGEMLPEDYGIKAAEKTDDGDGDVYVLLVIGYDGQTDDSSGMDLYLGSGDFQPVGKTLVGHRINEKAFLLPGGEWTLQGVCSSDCSRQIDNEVAETVDVIGASVHHGSVVSSRMRMLTEDGFTFLVRDEPSVEGYQPARAFVEHKEMVRDMADIVVDCKYDMNALDEDSLVKGGLGKNHGFCFGTVTTSPPLGVSTCDSTPTEITLEAVFNFEFSGVHQDPDEKEDDDKRRRRRSANHIRTKRQEYAFDWEFSRGVDHEDYDYMDDVLNGVASNLEGDPVAANSYNNQLMDNEQTQICRMNGDLGMKPMKRVTVPDLPDADSSLLFDADDCQEFFKGVIPKSALNNENSDDYKGNDDDDDDDGKSGAEAGEAASLVVVIAAALITMTRVF